jgi:hypothetical protein
MSLLETVGLYLFVLLSLSAVGGIIYIIYLVIFPNIELFKNLKLEIPKKQQKQEPKQPEPIKEEIKPNNSIERFYAE